MLLINFLLSSATARILDVGDFRFSRKSFNLRRFSREADPRLSCKSRSIPPGSETLTHELSARELSTHELSTHVLLTDELSTRELLTDELDLSTHELSTHKLSPRFCLSIELSSDEETPLRITGASVESSPIVIAFSRGATNKGGMWELM